MTREGQTYEDRKKASPHKIRARRLVQQMLLRGAITKEDCFICGQEKTEAHHLFYDFPKKILWLCHEHHRLFHRMWKEVKSTI